MNRPAYLHAQFAALEDLTSGRIRLEYTYSPGDRRGRRWIVSADGTTGTYNTRTAETFAAAALITWGILAETMPCGCRPPAIRPDTDCECGRPLGHT